MFCLSIIIPVFNGASSIYNTIKSIISNETVSVFREKIEIIVVDDGSTDDTKNIVLNAIFDFQDFKIFYYYQKNNGSSVARNKGLELAIGAYIWFFDADDILLDDDIGSIFKHILSEKVEVIAFKNAQIRNNQIYNYGCNFPVVKNRIITGIAAFKSGYNPSSVCCLIIKKDLFYKYKINFYPNITHQDVELTAKLIINVESIVFLDSAPYGYIYNSVSISKSKNKSKYIKYQLDNLIVAKSLKDYSIHLDIDKKNQILKVVNNIVWNYIYHLFTSRSNIDDEMYILFERELLNSGCYPLTQFFETKFQKITSFIFNKKILLKFFLFLTYKVIK
ncbi:glycosyltransferase [Acinetobacter towneri]